MDTSQFLMYAGTLIVILIINILLIRIANRVDKRVEQNDKIIDLLKKIAEK